MTYIYIHKGRSQYTPTYTPWAFMPRYFQIMGRTFMLLEVSNYKEELYREIAVCRNVCFMTFVGVVVVAAAAAAVESLVWGDPWIIA